MRPKGPAGCWIWSTDANRMDFKVDGVTWRAARWGYQHLMGSIPQEKVCLRICDTERCVNPAHHRPMERGRASSAAWRKKRHANGKATPPVPVDSSCTHYWILPPPAGPESTGTCRKCNISRSFPNASPSQRFT